MNTLGSAFWLVSLACILISQIQPASPAKLLLTDTVGNNNHLRLNLIQIVKSSSLPLEPSSRNEATPEEALRRIEPDRQDGPLQSDSQRAAGPTETTVPAPETLMEQDEDSILGDMSESTTSVPFRDTTTGTDNNEMQTTTEETTTWSEAAPAGGDTTTTPSPVVSEEESLSPTSVVPAEMDQSDTTTSTSSLPSNILQTGLDHDLLLHADPSEVQLESGVAAGVGAILTVAVMVSVLTLCVCRRARHRKNVYATMEEEAPKEFSQAGPPIILQHEISDFRLPQRLMFQANPGQVTEL